MLKIANVNVKDVGEMIKLVNFICKCGKSYLSYPALYTHIKTKHQDESIKICKLLEGDISELGGVTTVMGTITNPNNENK